MQFYDCTRRHSQHSALVDDHVVIDVVGDATVVNVGVAGIVAGFEADTIDPVVDESDVGNSGLRLSIDDDWKISPAVLTAAISNHNIVESDRSAVCIYVNATPRPCRRRILRSEDNWVLRCADSEKTTTVEYIDVATGRVVRELDDDPGIDCQGSVDSKIICN